MTSLLLNSLFLIGIIHISLVACYNVICYYDTFSINRLGTGNFTNKDLKNGLPFCNVVIYGYIGIDPQTFEVTHLHPLQHRQFAKVRLLKLQNPNVKFLVSLGGDKDLDGNEKYLHLLEADVSKQKNFIKSAVYMVKKYKFDGFDLAYQFPKNWISQSLEKNKTAIYRRKMTQLIKQLEIALKVDNLQLSLTVLPNVHAKSFYNVTGIINSLDYVILAAFDFFTPNHSPKEANYLAPLKPLSHNDLRHKNANVLFVLKQWTWSNLIPSKKLYLGITAHGRTWNTTKPLKNPKMPIKDQLNGPGLKGPKTRTPGLLAWPEICKKLPKITKVTVPMYGNFGYRPGLKKKDQQGLLIIYENRDSIVDKVKFVKHHQLGGVGFFDLSTDDYRGRCWGERYELLKEVKKNLL